MKFEELKVGSKFIQADNYFFRVYEVEEIFEDGLRCVDDCCIWGKGLFKSKATIEYTCHNVTEYDEIKEKVERNIINYYKNFIRIRLFEDMEPHTINDELGHFQTAVKEFIDEFKENCKKEND